MSILDIPHRYIDPRFHTYVRLTERRGLARPPVRIHQRPLPVLVGDEAVLSAKEEGYWRGKHQSWADDEIAPGVPRCPMTYSDHQWPVHRQQVRIRFRAEIL